MLYPFLLYTKVTPFYIFGFPGGAVGKSPLAKAGDARDMDLVPGQEDPLEEEMATHSSVLAGTIPRVEEPGRLQSMGPQRVGQNGARTHTHTHTHCCCLVTKSC